jgi:CBS domain-containing protein
MRVQEVMTRNVALTHPDSTLQDAADRMKELDVGVLPVCEDDQLVGVLTDRDLAVRCVSAGLDPWTDKVRDVMTTDVVFCFEDADVAEAARIMKERQIRRLIVLDRAKRLAGIVSLGDLAVDADAERVAGDVLQAVSTPGTPVE